MGLKKGKIDKQILSTYNNEERYELKTLMKTESSVSENVYDEDGTYTETDDEEVHTQKQILQFKQKLKHFQNYTRTTIQCLLVIYIFVVLLILPILSKVKTNFGINNKRSSVMCIQGSLIVLIHTKLLLTDHGLPGISNSQRVTKQQSYMIHGMVGLLLIALFLKNYASGNGYLELLVYFIPLTVFESMLVFFQLWCYQTEKDIENLVELSYATKSL